LLILSFQFVGHVVQKIFDLESLDWQNSGLWGHPCPMDTFLVTLYNTAEFYIKKNRVTH
jgi:hypothetical protein